MSFTAPLEYSLTLVQGDTYTVAIGRALQFLNLGGTWPDLTEAKITFEVEYGALIAAGTVIVPVGPNQEVQVELSDWDTNQIGPAGIYTANIVASFPGTGTGTGTGPESPDQTTRITLGTLPAALTVIARMDQPG